MQTPGIRSRAACIIALTTVLTWLFRHYQLDDSLIYARYIRNALQGHGLVYNLGEHVNALTSPLYSAITLLMAWLLRGHILLAENLVFILFFAAAAILAERIAPWSGLLIVSTAYFYYCIGMETALFLFMLILLATLYLESRDGWIPLVALLLVLVRLEGGALALVVAVKMLRERRFPSWRAFLLPALVVAGYLLFNFEYYGALLPSSGLAKLAQARSGYFGRWPTAFLRLPSALYAPFLYSIYVVPLALILAARSIWKSHAMPLNRLLLPSGLILLSFYILCNIPHYHWYYAPFIFFIFISALLGTPRFKGAQIVVLAVVLQCFAAAAYQAYQIPAEYPYQQLGEWLETNTAKDARVATLETGAIGWYSQRYVDDLIGLTTPENAVYLEHHDLYSWLNQQKPDYVVMHEKPSFGEMAAAASSDYEYLPIHFGSFSLMRRRPGAGR